MESLNQREKRVAIVAGLRTPFAKRGTQYRDLSARALGTIVVKELMSRSSLPAETIDQIVYGQVIPSIEAPNIAREVGLAAGLPKQVDAFSVSRACATSYQSAVSAAEAIVSGAAEVVIAGGADSASDIPMTVSRALSDALQRLQGAKTVMERIRALQGLSGKDFLPIPPALKELSTGLSMGESAEKMAKENGISREDQDAFAHRSHTKASESWRDGRFAAQVMAVHVPPAFREVLEQDNLVRMDSKLESYARLKPVFDRKHGTVTAGNSSPLTDGASAVILMREDKAKALGYMPLGYIKSYAFAALDPNDQLLMGPSYATPLALDRAGMTLADMDLVDMHEAFAAQILSNTQAFASRAFAEKKLGRSAPIGEIDWESFNVSGGSISIGHPFAATGTRQIMQSLEDLRRKGGQHVLCTACAAGGIGAAIVLERGEA